MVLSIKSIPSFKRGDHVDFKYILTMSFDFFKIPKQGAKPKIKLKMTLNDLYMTFEVKVDL